MSVIDGGSFKCYSHDPVYETVDPAAWKEHLNDGKHTESGSGVCVVCGNPTEYKNKPTNKKPVCDKCKEDLK
jgi:hypothetical protein